MQITKSIFDQIKPGEIFREVTTKIHSVEDLRDIRLTFVCVKGKTSNDWRIYFAMGTATADDIARYGAQLENREEILSICPCDEEVMALYTK